MTPLVEGSERFVVTELEGYSGMKGGGDRVPGISCHVIDTAFCHRMMATFRSEVLAPSVPRSLLTREGRLEYARELARAAARKRAAELNAGQLVAERQLQLTA